MAILRFLALAPVTTFIAAAILIALIALWGETLLPIGAGWRLAVMIILASVWALFTLFWFWRRRRRQARMLAEMAEPDGRDLAIGAERSELNSKFAAAMKDLARLRFKGRGGRRSVYELPWYIFIGPPAAGKTEALEKCGLEFPLRRGKEPIDLEGGSGTPNCNWVFTNEAVFIDTAGRYTMQESDVEVDSAAWRRFIDLLVKHRPREPLNGVIIAISLSDLASANSNEIESHANAIHKRLQELYAAMEARIPVYVIFTKADLLVGFNEFFQGMRQEDRAQVWGATFDLNAGRAPNPEATLQANLDAFDQEFDALTDRLGELQFKRLQNEVDLGQRAKVFNFAAQFSSMKPVLSRFMQQTFAPDRYSKPVLLRGFYFTSATQIGQPIDRLIATLSQEFGVDRQAVDTMWPHEGRAYFLRDLLTKVIFAEAGMVKRTSRAARPWGRYAAMALGVVLPLALAGGLWRMHAYNKANAAEFEATMRGAASALGPLELNRIDTGDPTEVLPALNRLRDEIIRLEGTEPPLPYGLGVDRADDLLSRARQAYVEALRDLLRPRLLHLFETSLVDGSGESPERYDALKAYLLLIGKVGLAEYKDFLVHQTRETLADQYNLTEEQGYREEVEALFRADAEGALQGHVGALIDAGYTLWPTENSQEIRRARLELQSLGYPSRVLRKMSHDAEDLDPWTLKAAGGETAHVQLVRISGTPFDEGIPALYTRAGYAAFIKGDLPDYVAETLNERWVLQASQEEGGSAPPEATPAELRTAISQTRELYLQTYRDKWRAMLSDIRIAPFTDARSASRALPSATSMHTALRDVLAAIAEQTRLSTVSERDMEAFQDSATGKQSERALRSMASRVGGVFGNALMRDALTSARENAASDTSPTLVDQAFADLHRFVDGGQMTAMFERISDFGRIVTDMYRNGDSPRVLSGAPEALALRRMADEAPAAVSEIMNEVIDQAGEASSARAVVRLREDWRNSVYPTCVQKLHGRYPFGRGGDAAIGDLERLLGPDGLIDAFFKERLESYVDTTAWRWRPDGRRLGMSQETLNFFRDAQGMREMFFPSGGRRIGFRFYASPLGAIPEAVHEVWLKIGSLEAEFERGESGSKLLEWPQNDAEIGLELEPVFFTEGAQPARPAADPTLRRNGAWGLFKLLEDLRFRTRDSGGNGRLIANLGGHRVMLELQFESSDNPFHLRDKLRAFKCPETL